MFGLFKGLGINAFATNRCTVRHFLSLKFMQQYPFWFTLCLSILVRIVATTDPVSHERPIDLIRPKLLIKYLFSYAGMSFQTSPSKSGSELFNQISIKQKMPSA